MVNENFREASADFKIWLGTLNNVTNSMIPQAQKMLDGDDPNPMEAPSRESAAELTLRGISERIDDVMSAFDKMLKSIDMGTRYQSYWDNDREY